MTFGAVLGSLMNNIFLGLFLAFLSHYLLDLIPHIDYKVKNILEAHWKKSLPEFIKVFSDILVGIILILIFSQNNPTAYLYAFVAILPDFFPYLNALWPNKFSEKHNTLNQKIHFLKYKKISPGWADIFWRIFSQIAVVIISIALSIFLR
jgi:hypothetical protein